MSGVAWMACLEVQEVVLAVIVFLVEAHVSLVNDGIVAVMATVNL
jgi:hypothetical protein